MNGTATYYNHLSGISTHCEVSVFENKLYIYPQGNKDQLVIWDLSKCSLKRSGGFLSVSKNDQKIECSGELAMQIEWAAAGDPPLKKKKQSRLHPVYTFIILFILFMIGICVFVYMFAIPWVAEKTASLIPMDYEIKMGEAIGQNLENAGVKNDSADFYAKKFVAGLNLDTEYPVQVKVLNSEEINAFALPGGKIFIYSGLLKKMTSYKQLAALLGHELTHVTRQHSLKSIFRGAAASIVIGSLFGDFGGVGAWIVSKADEFKQLDYSRDLESEADNYGLELMVKNKIDPQGMVELLNLLKVEGEETPALMKYLSTHPDTEARIANISANPAVHNSYPQNSKLDSAFKGLERSLAGFK